MIYNYELDMMLVSLSGIMSSASLSLQFEYEVTLRSSFDFQERNVCVREALAVAAQISFKNGGHRSPTTVT